LHERRRSIPPFHKHPLHLAEQYQFSKIANLLRKAQGEQAIRAALANAD
jgi:hypothetical protein